MSRRRSNPRHPAPAAASPRPPAATDLPWSRGDGIFILAVIAGIFLAYQPAWHAGFIWDDEARLLPFLGANPAVYHLIAIGVHAANVLLLWRVLRTLGIPGARWAAALFALHPIMVESVAWITESRSLLSVFFYLAGALAYLRFDADRRWPWYAVALGAFALALLERTSAATLPGALLLLIWWRNGQLSWKANLLPLLPFLVLGAARGIGVASAGAKAGADLNFTFTLVERGLIAARALWFYLGKIIFPADLVFMYPRWFVRQDQLWQYLYPAGILTGLAALWLGRRFNRGPLTAALFFIGALFPVLGFFYLSTFDFSFVADHQVYLASAGVFALAGAGLAALPRWLGRPATQGLGLALLAFLGIMAWNESREYRNAETLYRGTLEKNPEAWVLHAKLGQLLLETGRYEEAISHLVEARDYHPESTDVLYNLGLALAQMHRMSEALPLFQETAVSRPDDAAVQFHLASALLQTGRTWESVSHFQKALRLDPGMSEARTGLDLAQRELAKPFRPSGK